MKDPKGTCMQEYTGEFVFNNAMSVTGYSATFTQCVDPEPFCEKENIDKPKEKAGVTLLEG